MFILTREAGVVELKLAMSEVMVCSKVPGGFHLGIRMIPSKRNDAWSFKMGYILSNVRKNILIGRCEWIILITIIVLIIKIRFNFSL